MANKTIQKIDLDVESFLNILKARKLSIRKMGADPEFCYDEKSIRRAIKHGRTTPTFMYHLFHYLNVDPQVLIKKYEKENKK